MIARLLLAALLLAPAWAWAAQPSNSYLTLRVDGGHVAGRWDIALRDLDHALGLDADGDRALTWDEVSARHDAIAAYALARLALANAHPGGAAPCPMVLREQLLARHGEEAHAVLLFDADCLGSVAALEVRYGLFADTDPQHRGLLEIRHGGGVVQAPLPPGARRTMRVGEPSAWSQLLDYLRYGAGHAWASLHHPAMLAALLLPAGLLRRGGAWQVRPDKRLFLLDAGIALAALLLANGIAVALAAAGAALPARAAVIAASAVAALAAANLLRPVFPRHQPLAGFAFALLHGLGFAGRLSEAGLQGTALPLAGYNAGVALTHLAMAALLLPALWWTRKRPDYSRRWLPAAALLALLAALPGVAGLD